MVSLALEKCSGKFKLTEAMPDWPHRGLAVFQEGMVLLIICIQIMVIQQYRQDIKVELTSI